MCKPGPNINFAKVCTHCESGDCQVCTFYAILATTTFAMGANLCKVDICNRFAHGKLCKFDFSSWVPQILEQRTLTTTYLILRNFYHCTFLSTCYMFKNLHPLKQPKIHMLFASVSFHLKSNSFDKSTVTQSLKTFDFSNWAKHDLHRRLS